MERATSGVAGRAMAVGVSIGYSCTKPTRRGAVATATAEVAASPGWGMGASTDLGPWAAEADEPVCHLAPVVALVVAVRGLGTGADTEKEAAAATTAAAWAAVAAAKPGQPRCRHIDRTASSRPCSCRH